MHWASLHRMPFRSVTLQSGRSGERLDRLTKTHVQHFVRSSCCSISKEKTIITADCRLNKASLVTGCQLCAEVPWRRNADENVFWRSMRRPRAMGFKSQITPRPWLANSHTISKGQGQVGANEVGSILLLHHAGLSGWYAFTHYAWVTPCTHHANTDVHHANANAWRLQRHRSTLRNGYRAVSDCTLPARSVQQGVTMLRLFDRWCLSRRNSMERVVQKAIKPMIGYLCRYRRRAFTPGRLQDTCWPPCNIQLYQWTSI